MRKTLIVTLWAILLLAIAGVALIFSAIAKGKIGYVPPVEELENPNLKFATQIISDDGVTMGTYSLDKDANRIYVGYDELSPHLVMLDVVVIPNCFGLFCNRHFGFRETHSCHRHRNSAKPCVFPLDLSILRLFAFCKVAVLCN